MEIRFRSVRQIASKWWNLFANPGNPIPEPALLIAMV